MSTLPPSRRVAIAIAFSVLVALLAPGCARAPEPAGQPAPAPAAPEEAPDAATEPAQPEMITRALKPFTGDYDAIVERRYLRALVPFSRTNYFVDQGGRQRGASYDALVEFEKVLNEQLGDKTRPIQVVAIPVRRDNLFQYLVEGRGDISLGNLYVTDERRKLVDFSAAVATGIDQIVVTGKDEPPLASAEELSGRTVHVRPTSSANTHLAALSAKLREAGKPQVDVVASEEHFEDEDLLEMVNADAFPATVVDTHVAALWSQVYPNVVVNAGAKVATAGEIAWAIRKDCPKLAEVVNGFVETHKLGTTFGNMMTERYFKSTKWIKNSTTEAESAKLAAAAELFKKYGKQYDFDYLMVAAQAYQESGIDQSVHSPVGAVGVMQVLPSTASGNPINIDGIEADMEKNIHAGVKYMRFMMDEYFKDAPMDEVNKCLFAFASYNAGPAKIARLRKEAEERGLNPNVWFQNVELVVAQRVGRETVTYVGNIYKYYVAYRLAIARRDSRAAKK